ncbi:MAG: L,D-transpeptidase [Pyrinomonadaceae bacterium]|nr:L,D-transpeptidase [Pyrinomonadaceae bacterium]
MIKTAFVFLMLSATVLAFILSDQELIMARNKSDLPKMENPRILIRKEARTLEVFDGEKLIKTYKIALGFAPKGDKEIEGDGKTPEGDFYIFTKNSKSRFFLSLGLSYPAIEDAKRGLEKELIDTEQYDLIVEAINEKKMPPQETKLGGEIYIHGDGNATDWTAGCIALKNSDMKELFEVLPIKTPVRIEP